MDKEIKKILILGVITVLVLILLIVIFLFGTKNNPATDEFTTLPAEDITAIENFSNLPDSDISNTPTSSFTDDIPVAPPAPPTPTASTNSAASWQDEVVTSSNVTQIDVASTPPEALPTTMPSVTSTGLNPQTGQPYSREDLENQGSYLDNYKEIVTPIDISTINFSEPEFRDISTESLFPSEPIETEKLKNTSFKNCGSASLGATEGAIEKYLSSLANKSEASCLGKAVANDCQSARVRMSAVYGTVTGSVYVTERNDGVCGVGIKIDGHIESSVPFCSITDLLNTTVLSEDHKDFAGWANVLEKEPGKTIETLLIASESQTFAQPVNCISYEL